MVEKYWRIGIRLPREWRELAEKVKEVRGCVSVMEYLRLLVRRDLENLGLLKPG